jgi:soluble lytic murein transglycosylase-like protein
MRWCLCLFLTCAVLVCATLTARAASPPGVVLYAATLRAFDPGLDDAHALRLATRTILESNAYGLDARLVVALVAVESSWNPHAVSSAGARGLGQIMPATASGLGVDPDDETANLHGTVRHLRGLLDRFARYPPQAAYERSIAAYNAGAGAVERYDGIPPFAETQAYVRKVIGLWRRLAGL